MSVNQYLKPISEGGQDSGGIKAGKGIKADDEASVDYFLKKSLHYPGDNGGFFCFCDC